MKHKSFYSSLYRAVIIKYTQGNTNSSRLLSSKDKRIVRSFFKKAQAIYLYVLLKEQNPKPNEVNQLRKALFIYINRIHAKPPLYEQSRRTQHK